MVPVPFPTCLLQRRGDGDGRSDPHHVRRDPHHGARPQHAQHRQTQRLHGGPPAQQHRRRPVAHLAGVTWKKGGRASAAVDRTRGAEPVLTCRGAAVRFEGGSQPGEPLQSGSGSDALVSPHLQPALLPRVVHHGDGDGNDLPVEPTRLLGLGRSANTPQLRAELLYWEVLGIIRSEELLELGAEGEGVLLLPGDSEPLSDVLRRDPEHNGPVRAGSGGKLAFLWERLTPWGSGSPGPCRYPTVWSSGLLDFRWIAATCSPP